MGIKMAISDRLRDLRDKNGWTTAEMSYRSGLPKRSLEKYMLREGASLPGFDALVAIANGLGVSLDWLVLGGERSSTETGLIVERCTFEAALSSFDIIVRRAIEGEHQLYKDGAILQMAPEEWAAHIAHQAAQVAKSLSQSATNREALLEWKAAKSDQLSEIMDAKMERFKSEITQNDQS